MSAVSESLREAATDLMRREQNNPGGEFSEALWQRLESVELPLVGIPEISGGAGGGLEEAVVVARTSGYFALAAPLVETSMLAGRALAEAGFKVPNGPLTLVAGDLQLARQHDDWQLTGVASRIPWASIASHLVIVVGNRVALVDRNAVRISTGANLAGEPRDEVAFTGIRLRPDAVREAAAGSDAAAVRAWGALARSAQIAGALERILEMTVLYAQDRQQFGRPIAKFQALQHGAAGVAGELAATQAALEAAVERPDLLHIGIAKSVSSAAAGSATRFAHQVHGALGFTDEHPLYHYTTRLWSWRDEFGSEEEWAIDIGRAAAAAGVGLWEVLA